MTYPVRWCALVALLGLVTTSACSPALDWREFVPEGSGIQVSFPCRPDRIARELTVAGQRVTMQMLTCSAGGTTYAVSFFDVDQPMQVSASLDALQTVAIANVQGTAPRFVQQPIKGRAPNDRAARLVIEGHRPDGAAVQEQAVFFTRGLRVYQAVAIGAALSAQATQPFFDRLQCSV